MDRRGKEMKLKLPNFIRSKHIDLHVYSHHASTQDCGFVSIMGRTKKDFMRPTEYASIATCRGFVEMQRRSVQLKSWQEFGYNVTNGMTTFEGGNPEVTQVLLHSPEHSNGFAEKHNLQIFKITPPFRAQCEEEVDFVMTPSPFLYQNVCIPSGITNFKYNHSLAMFLYVHKNINTTVKFNLNDSIVCFTPMSDRRVKVHNHYDKTKHNELVERSMQSVTNNSYAKVKKVRKEYEK